MATRTASAPRTSIGSWTRSTAASRSPAIRGWCRSPRSPTPKNDYNLNIPRYIDSSEPEDLQDITAHLRGGLPNHDLDDLGSYWQVFPGARASLFQPAARPGYSELKVDSGQVKATIFGHPEFTAFNRSVTTLFEKWRKANRPKLTGIAVGERPKTLIETLSEHLLAVFALVRLVDPYDVYQHLMTYWADVMQDDVYALVHDGWTKAAQPQRLVEDKEKKTKEKPDLVIGRKKYKAELIPPALLVARYFAPEQAEIEKW